MEYQILMSIPGFGPVYSSGILAELGSVQAFPSNDAVAKYDIAKQKTNSAYEQYMQAKASKINFI